MDDQVVTMRLTTPSSPMVFETSNGLQETIMPMFVGEDSWINSKPVPVLKPEDIEESERDSDYEYLDQYVEPELNAEDNEHLNEHNRQTIGV